MAESLLELEPELELEGLRLSRELENFHWGILGMSMQKVVVASCSPSRHGESARAAAEDEDLALGSRGGRGRLGAEEGTTGVATTLPLMAKLCIRSSEEVTDSLRKRSYFGLRSMPGGAAWSRSRRWDNCRRMRGERGERGGWEGRGRGQMRWKTGTKTRGKASSRGGKFQSESAERWSVLSGSHAVPLPCRLLCV